MQLIYFAWVREKIGMSEEDITLPDHVQTVADLLDWLTTRGENYEQALENRERLRIAVDQDYAPLDRTIKNAREIAIFPPVTGG